MYTPEIPDFLRTPQPKPKQVSKSKPETPDFPDYLRPFEYKPAPIDGDPVRALMFTRFEVIFPGILERISSGASLKQAIKELPYDPPMDVGVFTHWMKKNPKYWGLYNEAKEIRTEAWTGRMIELAEGTEENPVELDRAKTAIDVYKWLVSRENKKQYGETKTIEMNTTISITAALEQATGRVIDAQVIDEVDGPRQITSGDDDDGEWEED